MQNPHPYPPPSPLPLTPPPSSSNTPESGDSVYVLRRPRPLLGFVQIGLFASPELPNPGRRHQRVEGSADVERESPKGGGGHGGGRGEPRRCYRCEAAPSSSPLLLPSTPPTPSSLRFTSELVRREPPLLCRSPRLYKSPASRVPQPDLRVPDFSARDGDLSRRISRAPEVDTDPAGDQPSELDAVAELHQTGDGVRDHSGHRSAS